MRKNKTKLVAYLGMTSLLASLIVGLLGFSSNTAEVNNIKNQLLNRHVENNINLTMKYINTYYGDLSPGNKTILDGSGNSIEGSHDAVDAILEDLGDKSTIFVRVNDDFKRISTNIMSENNERAIGTFLGTEHVAYKTVMQGDIYIGEAEILGNNYYTAYKPIKDENGNVFGLLFIGTPTSTLDNLIKSHDVKMGTYNILLIVLRAISLGSLIILVSASVTAREKYNPKLNTCKDFSVISEELAEISKELNKHNLDDTIDDLRILIENLRNQDSEPDDLKHICILVDEQFLNIKEISDSGAKLSKLTDDLTKLIKEQI